MHQDAFGRWRRALRQVLTAYLDGAYLRVRSRWAFPLQWELAPQAVQSALEELALSCHVMEQEGYATGTPKLSVKLGVALERCQADPEGSLTAGLAQAYDLQTDRCQADARAESCTVPLGPNFDPIEYLETDSRYLAPVVRLAQLIQEQMSPYLAFSLIHGSIGDLNYCKGYSDLDTLLVLNQGCVTDSASLRKFAKVYYHSLVELYRFDPLQHHGHMVMTAVDLNDYPQDWLPLTSFTQARVVCRSSDEVLIRTRDDKQAAWSSFEDDLDYFHLHSAKQWVPPDAYSFKEYLSILMLLPTRYLQAKGLPCNKRESFELAKQTLPNAPWEVMDYATELRSHWPFVRSNVLDVMSHVSGLLNVQRSRMIQRITLDHQYRKALSWFSPYYRDLARELAQQMSDNLRSSDIAMTPVLKSGPISAGRSASLAIINHPVYRSLDEYQGARDCYVNWVKDAPGVVSVHEYGSIRAPGLSDLDFLVAVSEGSGSAGRIDASRLSVDPLPFLVRGLILHDALVVPETEMRFVYEFLPEAELKELWPDSSRSVPHANADSRIVLYAKVVKLVEKLFGYQVWLVDTCDVGVLDARWAIATLRSMRYAISMLESATGVAPSQCAAFLAEADQLSLYWFGEPSVHRKNDALRSLHSLALGLVEEMIGILDTFLITSGWLTMERANTLETATFSTPRTRVSVGFEAEIVRPAESGRQFRKNVSQLAILPRSFLRIFTLYAQHAPEMSRVLTIKGSPGSTPTKPTTQTEFEDYVSGRASRLEAQTRFLLQHRFWFGSYLPGQLLSLNQSDA